MHKYPSNLHTVFFVKNAINIMNYNKKLVESQQTIYELHTEIGFNRKKHILLIIEYYQLYLYSNSINMVYGQYKLESTNRFKAKLKDNSH